jgi:hypothetical protein
MVVLADFNGDGHLDLAHANENYGYFNVDPQGTVSLWYGDGRGGLRHGPVLRDTDAAALAALDADGDGDMDLLAGGPLLLWRNEGHGKLVPQAIPMPDTLAMDDDDLTTGDVDRDGDIDIVLASGPRLVVGLNDGRGHWQFREVPQKIGGYNEPYKRVALADVDGDGDLDLLSPGKRGNLLLNDGKGRFGHEQRLPASSGYSVAIGDLNGDGLPDLVMDMSDLNQGKLGVYLNDGAGHFGAAPLSQTLVQAGDSQVALGDVDHDGDLDLVIGGAQAWVRLNRGRGQFDPAYRVAWQPSDIVELHLADINHDGQLDILAPVNVTPARHRQPRRASVTTLAPPTGNECYEKADQMPKAVGGGELRPVVDAAMQPHLVLPPGYSARPEYATYRMQLIIGKSGAVEHVKLGGEITPAVDSAMLDTLRHLRFVPGRLHGRAVRVVVPVLPQLSGDGPPRTLLTPEPGEDIIYPHVEHMPTCVGGGALMPFLREQALNQLILPDSAHVPPHSRALIGLIVEKDGTVSGYQKLEGINPDIYEALGELGSLPLLVPGRHHGRRVRVALQVSIPLTGAHAPLRQSEAARLEAQTRQRGWARRHPGETDARFVRRVLPFSLTSSGKLTAYAWRPSVFGKQLFLTVRPGQGDNEQGTDLLVLDPYRPNLYALRVLPVRELDDQISLLDFFFADVNHDGSPELLALKQCDLRGTLLMRHGRSTYTGSEPRYATDVFCLAGTDRAGRPRYRPDTIYRPYLDDLPTVAAVRRALARHGAARRKPRP